MAGNGNPVTEDIAPPVSQSWLGRLKTGLGKTSTRLSDGITGLFTKSTLGKDTLEDLENVLIEADLGLDTAERIVGILSRHSYLTFFNTAWCRVFATGFSLVFSSRKLYLPKEFLPL